jgi:hypothetical protein
MKMVTIAALVAAQLTTMAGPAQAAGPPSEEPATQQRDPGKGVELSLGDGQESASRVAAAPPRAAAAREDEPRKKRKSTGDKVLTGAAVVLGVGALAVGGLLVALFVS